MIIQNAIVKLVFFPNPQSPTYPPVTPVNLTGGSVILKIFNPVTSQTNQVIMTVDSSDSDPMNHFAWYITSGSDFPNAGVYIVQAFVTDSGFYLPSPEEYIEVGGSL